MSIGGSVHSDQWYKCELQNFRIPYKCKTEPKHHCQWRYAKHLVQLHQIIQFQTLRIAQLILQFWHAEDERTRRNGKLAARAGSKKGETSTRRGVTLNRLDKPRHIMTDKIKRTNAYPFGQHGFINHNTLRAYASRLQFSYSMLSTFQRF